MANEIAVTAKITVTNGLAKDTFNPGSQTYDQTAQGGPTPGVISVGTSEESVAFGELSTVGWLVMRNLDPTNYVQWGFATTAYGGRLEAGETALFRLEPSTTVYLKANTAACLVDIRAYED